MPTATITPPAIIKSAISLSGSSAVNVETRDVVAIELTVASPVAAEITPDAGAVSVEVYAGVRGQQGAQGEPGTGSLVSILAAQDLAEFDLVTSGGVLADSGNTAHIGKAVGIMTEAALTGFRGDAQTVGEITNPAWSWVVNDRIFLNETSLDTSPPTSGFCQQIGVATGSTTINIDLKTPILL